MPSSSAAAPMSWDAELASFLERLSTAQRALLALLARKREHIVRGDHAALASLAPEEQRLGHELEACYQQRQELLAATDADGRPSRNLLDANKLQPAAQRTKHAAALEESRRQAALIRHECLSQWVAMQRSVLHLSHLLEIIATRGRGEPTYGRGDKSGSSGALIDQAV